MPWNKTTAFLSAALLAGGWTDAVAAGAVAQPSLARPAVNQNINYADGVYTATG